MCDLLVYITVRLDLGLFGVLTQTIHLFEGDT